MDKHSFSSPALETSISFAHFTFLFYTTDSRESNSTLSTTERRRGDRPANCLQKYTRTEPFLRVQKGKHPHGTQNTSYRRGRDS